MPDDELLVILASLDAWKQGLPRYEAVSDRPIPMLTQDRLLKGYYTALTLLLRPRTVSDDQSPARSTKH